MENLLNGCWVLLAMAALLAWRFQATQAQRPDRRLQLVALLCVLALMFPVISATDDLHPAPQAVEDSSKRTQKAVGLVKWVATRLRDGAATTLQTAVAMVVPHPSTVEWLQPKTVPSLQAGRRLFWLERSPPVLI